MKPYLCTKVSLEGASRVEVEGSLFISRKPPNQTHAGDEDTYCVIQITTPDSAESRTSASFERFSSNHPLVSHWTHVNSKGMHKLVKFNALSEAQEQGCVGNWFFIGDDDTLIFPQGISKFLSQRRKQAALPVAHGNLLSFTDFNSSWYTGGSGILISRTAAQSIQEKAKEPEAQQIIQSSFDSCNCFDVPFARVMQASGIRMFHSPTFFLDSCLECGHRLIENDILPVVSCHGVTIFRNISIHALGKQGDRYAEISRHLDYNRPAEFVNLTVAERVKYFWQQCSPSAGAKIPRNLQPINRLLISLFGG